MKRLFLSLALLVTACAPVAEGPQNLTFYLNKGFRGHPINQFFYEYGFPSGEFTSNDGAKSYRWTSIQPTGKHKLDLPRSTYENAEGSYELMDTYRTGVIRQYCEIRIYTDSNDIIRDFAIVVDSIGKWSPSRCSEIFDKKYP